MFFLHGGYLEIRKIACVIIGMFWILQAEEAWDSVTGKIEASDKVNQGDASAESQSSDRIPLFSKVLLREESGAAASNPSTRLGQLLMSRGLHRCRWATIWLSPAKLGRGIQTYSCESNTVFLYIDDANDNRLKYFNWNYLLHSKGSSNY